MQIDLFHKMDINTLINYLTKNHPEITWTESNQEEHNYSVIGHDKDGKTVLARATYVYDMDVEEIPAERTALPYQKTPENITAGTGEINTGWTIKLIHNPSI